MHTLWLISGLLSICQKVVQQAVSVTLLEHHVAPSPRGISRSVYLSIHQFDRYGVGRHQWLRDVQQRLYSYDGSDFVRSAFLYRVLLLEPCQIDD